MGGFALFFNKGVQPLTLVFADQEGIDRETTGRELTDDGNVQVPVGDERERPRDGRGRHDKKVRRLLLRFPDIGLFHIGGLRRDRLLYRKKFLSM